MLKCPRSTTPGKCCEIGQREVYGLADIFVMPSRIQFEACDLERVRYGFSGSEFLWKVSNRRQIAQAYWTRLNRPYRLAGGPCDATDVGKTLQDRAVAATLRGMIMPTLPRLVPETRAHCPPQSIPAGPRSLARRSSTRRTRLKGHPPQVA